MRLPAGAPGLRGCIWADQVTAQRPINGRVPRLHPFVHKDLLPSGGAISCEVGASPKRVYLPLQGGDFGTNAVKLETTIEWSTESKGAFHFMPIWAALPLVRGAIAYTRLVITSTIGFSTCQKFNALGIPAIIAWFDQSSSAQHF